MKVLTSSKYRIIKVVSILQALLFIYAATAKLLEYDNFIMQLGQSPLLAAFAIPISIGLPIIEIVIALMLLSNKWRFKGLLAALTLMIMFTTYIYVTLNYSSFIPCSCGGIIEDLTWNQHLLFNLIFVVLDAIAIVLSTNNKTVRHHYRFKTMGLLACTLIGTTSVVALYQYTEQIIHYKNNFTRRFPQHVAQQIHETDLIYNSYYIAGAADGKIYLGNYTAPLKILEIDTTLISKYLKQIELKEKNLPFKAPQIRIMDSIFFVYEGTVPYIFTGSVENWKASKKLNSGNFFSSLQPINNNKAAIRYYDNRTGEHLVGVINLADTSKVKYNKNVLQKQVDGVFDTDGSLVYNKQLDEILYTYYYRNEFIISDTNLNRIKRGKTIDTVNKAQITLVTNKDTGMKKLASESLVVNKLSATEGKILFINSQLPGQYEEDDLWKTAAIIDVYSLTDNSYRSSFPVYNSSNKKLKDMIIYDNKLYGLIGTTLVAYKLKEHLMQDKSAKELSK
ncbi:MauE/DoxX family redox-associated membrane protein [Flavobacterium sp.]